MCDHRAGANNRARTDCQALQNGRVGTDRRSGAHRDRPRQAALRVNPRIVAQDHIVTYGGVLIDLYMATDGDLGAEPCPCADDRAFVEQHVGPYPGRRVDQGRKLHIGRDAYQSIHQGFAHRPGADPHNHAQPVPGPGQRADRPEERNIEAFETFTIDGAKQVIHDTHHAHPGAACAQRLDESHDLSPETTCPDDDDAPDRPDTHLLLLGPALVRLILSACSQFHRIDFSAWVVCSKPRRHPR